MTSGHSLRFTLVTHGLILSTILLAWHLAPESVAPSDLVSRPLPVLRRLGELMSSGDGWRHIWTTSRATGVGILIGGALGVLLALAISRLSPLRRVLDRTMLLGYAVPKVVLITLFVLAFGIGFKAQVALAVSFVLFVFFFNVEKGLDEVDETSKKVLASLGASPLQTFRLLVVPSVVGYTYNALRVSLPLAYSVVIFAELRIGGSIGIGAYIASSARSLQPTGLMAGLILAAALGFLLDRAVSVAVARRASRLGLAVAL